MRKLSAALRREWPSLILITVLAALVVTFTLGQEGPRQLADLVAHRARLADENNHLQDENAQLELQIARLQTDDRYVQRLIRQQLGYVRSNELVYHFRSAEQPKR